MIHVPFLLRHRRLCWWLHLVLHPRWSWPGWTGRYWRRGHRFAEYGCPLCRAFHRWSADRLSEEVRP